MVRKNESGFTLVELMIVVAIIGVLAAIAIPQYIKYVERSQRVACYDNYASAVDTVRSELSKVTGPSNTWTFPNVFYANATSSKRSETGSEDFILTQLTAKGNVNPKDGTNQAFLTGAPGGTLNPCEVYIDYDGSSEWTISWIDYDSSSVTNTTTISNTGDVTDRD